MTRIPKGASSSARVLIRPVTPRRRLFERTRLGSGCLTVIEDMARMAPEPCLFMTGAALGAHLAGRVRRGTAPIHLLMAAAALLVPVWLRAGAGGAAGPAGFMFLSAAGGLLTGGFYRTVVDIAWPSSGQAPAALFYSWDLFGACVGGLVAGTLLVPLSGIMWSAASAAAIHLFCAAVVSRRVAASGQS